MNNNIPIYKDLVENQLEIKIEFLKQYIDIIWDRLSKAHEQMKQKEKVNVEDAFSQHRIFGINQCVHLASGVVLLAAHTDNLQKAIKSVGQKQIAEDPTTALTIATLYYLIKDYLWNIYSHDKTSDRKEIVSNVWVKLDEINWMIGENAMKDLQMETFKDYTLREKKAQNSGSNST